MTKTTAATPNAGLNSEMKNLQNSLMLGTEIFKAVRHSYKNSREKMQVHTKALKFKWVKCFYSIS